jgi:hypothetical protein
MLEIGRLIDIKHPILKSILKFERLRRPDDPLLAEAQEDDPLFFTRLPPAFGLFAKTDIPKHACLLEYTGEVDNYCAWVGSHSGTDDSAYTMTLEPHVGVKSRLCSHHKHRQINEVTEPNDDNYFYILDALFRGNEIRYINDYRDFSSFNLVKAFSAVDNPLLREAKENCLFKNYFVDGWEHMVVIAKSNIAKGQELLIDYGAAYWEMNLPRMYQAKQDFLLDNQARLAQLALDKAHARTEALMTLLRQHDLDVLGREVLKNFDEPEQQVPCDLV